MSVKVRIKIALCG